jgi:phosphoribosylanthranilate isomerase
MSLLVKICGLSTRETLDAALQAGADMVGFVFFPPSPRHLGLEAARELGRQAKGRAVRSRWPSMLMMRSKTSSRRCSRTFCNCTARKPPRGYAISGEIWIAGQKALAVETAAISCRSPAMRLADRICLRCARPRGRHRPGGLGAVFDWS